MSVSLVYVVFVEVTAIAPMDACGGLLMLGYQKSAAATGIHR
jgi:hypothetical protein